MAAKASVVKPSTLRVGNIPPEAKDDTLIRFLADVCPGRRIKCSLSRDANESHGGAFLQSAILDLPDTETAEAILLHVDGAVFMGRRVTVIDPVGEASSANTSKASSASDAKTFAKVRAACELLPSASLDQLRSIMSLLDRVSQSDADHLRQVLMSNPELSLALARAAERLQILDQPLKHVETPAAPPNATPAGAQTAASKAAAGGGYRPPATGAPPPPPPVNLPIEVQQALEMLLREYPLLGPHFMQHRELHSLEKINIIRQLPSIPEDRLRTLGRSGELLLLMRGFMVKSAQALAPPGGQRMW